MDNLLENLVDNFIKNQTNENFSDVIEALINSEVIMLNTELTGELKKLNQDGKTPLVIQDQDKKNYIPLFTSEEQMKNEQLLKLEQTTYLFKTLCNDSIITNDYIEGFVLNPFTQGLKLPKPVIEIVINYLNNDNQVS